MLMGLFGGSQLFLQLGTTAVAVGVSGLACAPAVVVQNKTVAHSDAACDFSLKLGEVIALQLNGMAGTASGQQLVGVAFAQAATRLLAGAQPLGLRADAQQSCDRNCINAEVTGSKQYAT